MTRSARVLCTLATAALLCSSAAAQWSGPNLIQPQATAGVLAPPVSAMTAGDLTLNGLPDIVVGLPDGAGVTGFGRYSLLQNVGAGNGTNGTSFTPGPQWGSGGRVHKLHTADMNGDLARDIVSVQETGSSSIYMRVKYLENSGSGTSFITHNLSPTMDGNVDRPSLEIADLNGDGQIDVVGGDGSGIHVWINQGTGTFAHTQISTSAPVRDLAIGRVDSDAYPDLIVAIEDPNNPNYDSIIGWYPGTGAGSFGSRVSVPGLFGWIREIETGDIDGDGDVDFVAYDWGGDLSTIGIAPRIWVGVNVGAGSGINGGTWAPQLMLEEIYFAGSGIASDLVVSDTDADGDADIVLSARFRRAWRHFEAVGTGGSLANGMFEGTTYDQWQSQLGSVTNPVLTFSTDGIDGLAVSDLNGDGTQDLIIGGDGAPNYIAWWANSLAAPFGVAITQPSGPGTDIAIDLNYGISSAPYFLVHSWDPANQSAWNQGIFLGLHISIPHLLNLLSLGVAGNVPWAGGALDANGAMSYTFVGSGASHVPSLIGMTVTAVAIQQEQIAPVQYDRTQLHSYTIQ